VARALLAALLFVAAAPVAANEAAVGTEVPAGQSKSVRLRNLPQGAVLTIAIVTSGRLLVALVGAKELKRSRSQAKTVFRGAVDRKLAFRITIPEADDYYLVLNNRKGTESLTVETQIRAIRGRAKPQPAPERGPEKASLQSRKIDWMRSISTGFTT
jgi:hypothetical protein